MFLWFFLQVANFLAHVQCFILYHLTIFNNMTHPYQIINFSYIYLFIDTWVICLFIYALAFISNYISFLFLLFSFSSHPLFLFSVSVSLIYFFKMLWYGQERDIFLIHSSSKRWNMPLDETGLLQQNSLERRWRIKFPTVTVYDDGLASLLELVSKANYTQARPFLF